MRSGSNRAALAMIMVIVLLVMGLAAIKHVMEPISAGAAELIEVFIPEGSSTASIASLLEEKGLISSGFAFKAYIRLSGMEGELKYGRYDLSMGESMLSMARKLSLGLQKGVVLRVPEGYTARQIAARAETLGLADYDEFMELVEAPGEELSGIIPFRTGGGLEGFLFPDTYEFSEGAGAKAVIKAMLDNFADKAASMITSKLKLDLSPEKVVVLASIVEKEALLSSELPIVAGVFMNRLNINMALQSCATVQYLLPEPKAVLSKEDTLIKSPYNTYLTTGLPPGPISNPGLAAIEAVLEPAKHDYLFFVANGDGSHSFSRTYGEHLQAKFSN